MEKQMGHFRRGLAAHQCIGIPTPIRSSGVRNPTPLSVLSLLNGIVVLLRMWE